MAAATETLRDSTRPLPGMRWALVVGLNYGGTQPAGRVARYARGDDYHRVMWDRLDALATMIQYERDTYVRWLASPEFVRSQLTAAFSPELRSEAWGKLVFAEIGRAHV